MKKQGIGRILEVLGMGLGETLLTRRVSPVLLL
jgi:hypothetical protein